MPLDFTHITAVGALVPLPEMKAFLRITDTSHDDDITAIRDSAQNAILAYLKEAADGTWTDLTVPLPVKHAIKLLTTHYFEHRGDDMHTMSDTEVWAAIDRLLSMYRDPTLA